MTVQNPAFEPDPSQPPLSGDVFRIGHDASWRVAHGIRRELPQGGISSLTQRVRDFFAHTDNGPGYLVGALPFEREQADYLFQPDAFAEKKADDATRSLAKAAGHGGRWLIAGRPTADEYRSAVAKCLEQIAGSATDVEPLRKVVLSRSLSATAPGPIDYERLIAVLRRDPSVTTFATLLPGGTSAGPRMLVGATPELLVSKSGGSILSHPLAGSARRSGDPAADRRSAAALEKSEKDHREHRAVVEAVMDALAPYCRELAAPDGTTLRPTASMWHLGTRIAGTLKDKDTPVVELVAALHPTPAVCGLPRRRAAEVIRELEGYDRGFYAGAVGYTDRSGDGEWHVSIRSADIMGASVRLYAGAGIVAGSDPSAETDETSAKFVALLSALGIDEHGRPLLENAA